MAGESGFRLVEKDNNGSGGGWKRAVAELRALGTAAGRARHGACSLEGTRLFERALRAGVPLVQAVTTSAYLADPSPRVQALLAELSRTGCELFVVPPEVMEELTEGRSIGALVGQATLGRAAALEALLAGAPDPFFLACTSIDSPGNLGALARTAHASGATALLTAGGVDPFHPMALRTSMGSLLRLPVLSRGDSRELVAELAALGVRTVGAAPDAPEELAGFDFGGGPVAVFVGSEAFGLDPAERGALDALVSIPMGPGVDSFSVNAAAATLLWELRRGRGLR